MYAAGAEGMRCQSKDEGLNSPPHQPHQRAQTFIKLCSDVKEREAIVCMYVLCPGLYNRAVAPKKESSLTQKPFFHRIDIQSCTPVSQTGEVERRECAKGTNGDLFVIQRTNSWAMNTRKILRDV